VSLPFLLGLCGIEDSGGSGRNEMWLRKLWGVSSVMLCALREFAVLVLWGERVCVW
jgi:hypothetical protein